MARELTRQEYLAAFETWIKAQRESGRPDRVHEADQIEPLWRAALEKVGDILPDKGTVKVFCDLLAPSISWGPLRVAIRKSNLLYRLLYGGEPLRTQPCPEHQGVWSGIGTPDKPDCPHGCGFTGWLPNPPASGFIPTPSPNPGGST